MALRNPNLPPQPNPNLPDYNPEVGTPTTGTLPPGVPVNPNLPGAVTHNPNQPGYVPGGGQAAPPGFVPVGKNPNMPIQPNPNLPNYNPVVNTWLPQTTVTNPNYQPNPNLPNYDPNPGTTPLPTPTPTPTPEPPPPSYDPPAGAPTFTPGMVFGQGVIPGQGADYQRQWFDVGPNAGTEALNMEYYNDPSNWNFAWDKVVNQFGGMPGGQFNDWLRDFSGKARADYQNAVPYDPNLDVANFLDAYAPQLKGVFGLIPGSQKGQGGRQIRAGRATY